MSRKLIATFFVSLDGVVEAPQNWHFPYFNEEMGAVIGAAMSSSDAMLCGRVTYEEWAASWPDSDNEMAAYMNNTPKYNPRRGRVAELAPARRRCPSGRRRAQAAARQGHRHVRERDPRPVTATRESR